MLFVKFESAHSNSFHFPRIPTLHQIWRQGVISWSDLFIRWRICGKCAVRHPVTNRLDVVEHLRKLYRRRSACGVYPIRILNRTRTVGRMKIDRVGRRTADQVQRACRIQIWRSKIREYPTIDAGYIVTNC